MLDSLSYDMLNQQNLARNGSKCARPFFPMQGLGAGNETTIIVVLDYGVVMPQATFWLDACIWCDKEIFIHFFFHTMITPQSHALSNL